MSPEDHVEKTPQKYGGRGPPEEYETYEREISHWKYAVLELMAEAELVCVGWDDDAPKYEDDTMAFVFDHPDHDGGFMVPIRYEDLTFYRASRASNGWYPEEDVGVFDPLPDWVYHKPTEGDNDGE